MRTLLLHVSLTKQPTALFQDAQPRSAVSPGPRALASCPAGAEERGAERGVRFGKHPAPPAGPAAAFRPLPLAPGVPGPFPRGAEQRGAERGGKCSGAERPGSAGAEPRARIGPRRPAPR